MFSLCFTGPPSLSCPWIWGDTNMQSISTFEEKERLHEVVITKYSLYEGKFSRMRRFLLKPACFRGILSETTQQGINSSELKPLDVSWLLMPRHHGFLKTLEQQWQRTTSSTFSEANSWPWDYFHCTPKIPASTKQGKRDRYLTEPRK